jgi:hypothetical protein
MTGVVASVVSRLRESDQISIIEHADDALFAVIMWM